MALIFAFLFTGFGQIYLGKIKQGLLFAFIHLLCVFLLTAYLFHPFTRIQPFIWIPAGLLVVFELYVIVDAYLYACKLKSEKPFVENRSFPEKIFTLLLI